LALGQDSLALALESVDFVDAVEKIAATVLEKKPERIYVGLPVSLSGVSTESTKRAVGFAATISNRVTIPVFVIDERLTTVQSLRLIQQAGKSAKASKWFVDAEAARLIVESAILSGHTLGVEVGDYLARN
jgi:putative Holliday junction resolvase